MKKLWTAGVTAALLLSLAIPALALEQAVPISAILPPSNYSLAVDGKPVDAQVVVMVPVRAVGEALGFTVTWDKTIGGAKLDNGKVHTQVVPGRDLFVVTSSTAIGMTAPFSLGGEPTLMNGTLYVPVGLFRPLLGNRPEAVTVKDGVISISTETRVQIPNPITTHTTQAALEKAVGFAVPLPTTPTGYTVEELRDFSGTLAELRFVNGADSLVYRVSRGSENISGNYNPYATAKTLTVDGASVQCLGDGAAIHVATWLHGDFTFSLQSDAALTAAQVETLVKSVL